MAVWLNLIPQLHQRGDDDVSMRHHHFHERAGLYSYLRLPIWGFTEVVFRENFPLMLSFMILTDIFYDGLVAPEHQTHLPPPYMPPGPNLGTTLQDCSPNLTATPPQDDEEDDDDDGSGILQRLADSGYHSYAAALGVTVGVGCLLLLLNILIFAGTQSHYVFPSEFFGFYFPETH